MAKKKLVGDIPQEKPSVVIPMMDDTQKMPIGEETLRKALDILRKYKAGKSRLEAKIIANEEFWKLRQWNYMDNGVDDFKPATAYLWSCIQSRYSDAMDSYPTCNFQPRQQDDVEEAKMLSNIVPVILEQNRYEDTYSDCVWYALKNGGCAQGVFWDGSKHGGLGDISIKQIDFLNLFWQPGIKNIQDSQHIFVTELVDNTILEKNYPQTVGKLGKRLINVADYVYDDGFDQSDKSVVVDWYYKVKQNGKNILHYVKFVDDIVLYATENERQRPQTIMTNVYGNPVSVDAGLSIAETGLYNHGLYPFIVMALYPVESSICGYGLTDIGRDTQLQIDKLSKAITDNAVIGATPRYFIRGDGGVNEEEYADISKPFIHVQGNLSDDNIRPIDTKPLEGNYLNYLNALVEQLKFVTSNQDVANGNAPSGITAASAVAALQESAGKNSRSSNKTFHRAYREVCYQVLELIRQFYDVPRTFRIIPDIASSPEFVTYSNMNIKPQQQMVAGMDMGLRLPEFDIDVTSEKANPYKKMENNELALNFYNAGFFNPDMATQASECIKMMDFQKKDEVLQAVMQNGTIYEMMLNYQKIALELAQRVDPALADQLSQMILGNDATGISAIGNQANSNLDVTKTDEHPVVEKSRERARASVEAD